MARPARRTPAVQSDAPNSTRRSFSQRLTLMDVKNNTTQLSAKVNAFANLVGSVRQVDADAARFRQLQDDRAGGDVLDSEPHRLEDGDVRRLALICPAGDDVAQGAAAAPAHLALALGQDQVASFEPGGVDVVGHQQIRTGDSAAVNLAAGRDVRPPHVQVLTGLEPFARKDWLRCRGNGGQDVGSVNRFLEAGHRSDWN